MSTPDAPIGYWLKHLDGLIEAHFDRSLASHRLARRHWQALNTLAGGPLDDERLAEALRPFWTQGAVTLDEVLGELERRGWVARDEAGRAALTPEGRAGHAAVAERVAQGRRRTMDGLTPNDYRAAVGVLRRMAGNLERS
jgi:hypothetical protein